MKAQIQQNDNKQRLIALAMFTVVAALPDPIVTVAVQNPFQRGK